MSWEERMSKSNMRWEERMDADIEAAKVFNKQREALNAATDCMLVAPYATDAFNHLKGLAAC